MSQAPSAPPPIWIGDTSDAALRRGARLGDGWIGTGQHPTHCRSCSAAYDRLAFPSTIGPGSAIEQKRDASAATPTR
jgi:hypothetical protein